jgi:PAS domain S-box-containing protein
MEESMNAKKQPVKKSKSTPLEKSPGMTTARPPGKKTKNGSGHASTRGKATEPAHAAGKHFWLATDPTRSDYFKDIVATIREPLLVLDKDLRVLAANHSFYKYFKVKAGETTGKLVYELGNRQWDIPALRALLETILPQKAVFNDYQVEHEFPSLGKRILLLNARRIPAPPKEAQRILLAFEDVTRRRHLEQVLQDSEERFHRAFDTATDSMLLVDKVSGRVLNSNQAAREVFGYSRQALLEKNLWELDILKDPRHFKQVFLELEDKGFVQILDKTIQTRQGGQFAADINLMDRAAVIQCNIRDISVRKQAEEEIKSLALFPDENPNPILRVRQDGTLIYANLAAQARFPDFGYQIDKKVPAILDTIVKETFDDRAQRMVEIQKDGKTWSFSFVPIQGKDYMNVYCTDNTERKQAEETLQEYSMRLESDVAARTRELRAAQEELVRKEKLAMLGQMAGSVGHELRNPLGVINTSIYYLKMVQPEASEKIKQHLDIIERQVHVSDKIINDLLNFSREVSSDPKAVCIQELVQKTLVRFPPPRTVELRLDLPEDLPEVYADPQHMEQVLGNLVMNACQAMATSSTTGVDIGGTLSISAVRQKNTVALAVRDTGTGIPPENMSKLFEPLFTTKPRGIGLGLAVSQKLIEANGGRIEVESEVGVGSTFTLVLPVKPKNV